MISIGTPYIRENGNRTEIHAKVKISLDTAKKFVEETSKLTNVSWLTKCDYPPKSWEEDSTLWFSVPSEYGKYFCKEKSNAFVLAMFWYAMITGSDIKFEAPLSKRMHKGMTEKLIPALAKDGYRAIKLIGTTSDKPIQNEGGVVTGLTCGVDSTYTLHRYEKDDIPKELRLTHIVYCHADYLFPYIDPPYDVDELIAEHERKYNKHAMENAKKIATHHGLPQIEINTNFDRDFYRGGLIYTGMYRFFSAVMTLEHLFSTYLFTSSGSGVNNEEPSLLQPHYEDFLSECCSSENFNFIVSDHEERFTKLQVIADDPEFQKCVSTCSNELVDDKNCGECYGCWKTMVPLDMIGKLDKYGACFNVEKYKKNRRNIFEQMIRFSMRPESVAPKKIVNQILRHTDSAGEAGALFKEVYEECIGDKK